MSVDDREAGMLTAAQCETLASKYRELSQAQNISKNRAGILKNIARSYAGLASQLDRLAANIREEQS